MKIIRKAIHRLWRLVIYRHCIYGNIGKGNVFKSGVFIDDNSRIGNNNFFGKDVNITRSIIGNYCSIAPGVIIGPGEHNYTNISTMVKMSPENPAERYQKMTEKPVVIGNDVWIGARAIILRDVRIGNGAVIAAGAVVTKDVPDFAIAVGVPAKVKKYRFTEDGIRIINESKWWDLNMPNAQKRISELEKLVD